MNAPIQSEYRVSSRGVSKFMSEFVLSPWMSVTPKTHLQLNLAPYFHIASRSTGVFKESLHLDGSEAQDIGGLLRRQMNVGSFNLQTFKFEHMPGFGFNLRLLFFFRKLRIWSSR